MAKISLADFIAETLANISEGVRRAQDHSHSVDGVPIAPNNVDGKRLDVGDQLVRFHVLVETEASSDLHGKGTLGGALISVVTGSAEVEGTKNSRSSSQHTIEFAVPMHFHLRWAAQSKDKH